MTTSVPVSPATLAALLELAARTGRPVGEVLENAVEEFRQRVIPPVTVIPGVDPAEVWESAAEADAGRLSSHDTVFARLRAR